MDDSLNDAVGEVRYDFPFSQIPEWVLFHPALSDRAVRLYGIILRYGNSSGRRIPGRARLAAECRGCSVDSIDRAKAELEAVGALEVQHRFTPGRRGPREQQSNIYVIHSHDPTNRTRAASAGPTSRTPAAPLAAPLRHYREGSTDRPHDADSEPGDNPGRFAAGSGRIREFVAEPPGDPVEAPDFDSLRGQVRCAKPQHGG